MCFRRASNLAADVESRPDATNRTESLRCRDSWARGVRGNRGGPLPENLAIDVDPGSEENRINPRSGGVANVAVLTNDAFDPLDADVRYEFGAREAVEDGDGAAPVRRCVRDANGDGRDDLVLQFRTADCGFDGDESEAELRWYRNEERTRSLRRGRRHARRRTLTVTPPAAGRPAV